MDYKGNGNSSGNGRSYNRGFYDDDDDDKGTTGLKKATSSGGPGVSETGLAAVAAVGVGLLAWGVSSFFSSPSASSTSSEKKMMKAPGKKGQTIQRETFEKDPCRYFQDLRKK